MSDRKKRFVWHPRVHEEWSGSHLFFWRLAFRGTYHRSHVLSRVGQGLRYHRVGAFSISEVAGDFDLIVRAWLPPREMRAFDTTLNELLRPLNLLRLDRFLVSETLLHWLWDTDDGEMPGWHGIRGPLDARINERRHPAEIQRLNKLQTDGGDEDSLLPYLQDRLAARYRREGQVRFMVSIPQSDFAPAVHTMDSVRENLCKILRDSKRLKSVTFYHGLGFAQFLICGSVDSLDHLNSDLITKINDSLIGDNLGAHTSTYLVLASPEELRQELLLVEDHTSEPIDQLLAQEESISLEFKGSAFCEVDKWLHAGSEPAWSDETKAIHVVLKSIVGFLNLHEPAHRCRTLIIGVLERREKYEIATRLQALPRVAEKILLGIEWDACSRGSDAWLIRLNSLIAERITSDKGLVASFVRLRLEQLHGLTLCVVEVQQANSWFYIKEDASFYLREANRTSPLSGPKADAYKREHPR